MIREWDKRIQNHHLMQALKDKAIYNVITKLVEETLADAVRYDEDNEAKRTLKNEATEKLQGAIKILDRLNDDFWQALKSGDLPFDYSIPLSAYDEEDE